MNTLAESRGTVLVVDDDPSVLVLIERILTRANYRVLPAAERADAIRLVGQKHLHISVALLDVRIPGVSGTELADEILSIRPDLRVLWMSGFVDDDIIRIRMLDGFAGFLSKPFQPVSLLQTVAQAIEGKSGGVAGLGHPAAQARTAGPDFNRHDITSESELMCR
jgi:two-component system cell cycle sensor histidine kinase/response regulator CckA